jgi:hypothetical protein
LNYVFFIHLIGKVNMNDEEFKLDVSYLERNARASRRLRDPPDVEHIVRMAKESVKGRAILKNTNGVPPTDGKDKKFWSRYLEW